MPLPIPKLDDRTFQNIVDEAKTRLRTLAPAWTDHNVSDPGVTLIELFAWMTEMIIYRLNRVPERQYITLLQLLGIELEPPQSANTQITFRFTRPFAESDLPAQTVIVPEGAEISTVATAQNPVVTTFQVDQDTRLAHPGIVHVFRKLASQNIVTVHQNTVDMLMFGNESTQPAEGDSIYFGFPATIADYTLRFELTFGTPKPSNYEQSNPPLEWQAWSKEGMWVLIRSERDLTGGLINDGTIDVHVPHDLPGTGEVPPDLIGTNAPALYYIRCIYKPRFSEQGAGAAITSNPNIYDPAPKLKQVKAMISGITARASHSARVLDELLGVSDGHPSQRFKLAYTPVLKLKPGESVEVEANQGSGVWEPWTLVESFDASKESDKHFQIDYVSGEVCFGPSIRLANGSAYQYGQIPPRGTRIRVNQYRYGGGVVGNLPTHTLTVLKRALPYVVPETYNYLPSSGGRDPETIEQAMLRARQKIRAGEHAVTLQDFERLALLADPERVARAHCIEQVGQRTVRVLIVRKPKKENIPQTQPISKELLAPIKQAGDRDAGPRDHVQKFLDERRMLTTIVEVGSPRFVEVAIKVGVRVRPNFDQQSIRKEVEQRLYRFINPLTGGNINGGEGDGWAFGRGIYPLDILMLLQAVPGIELIDQLSFEVSIWKPDLNAADLSKCWEKVPQHIDPYTTHTSVITQEPIIIAPDDIVISGEHKVV